MNGRSRQGSARWDRPRTKRSGEERRPRPAGALPRPRRPDADRPSANLRLGTHAVEEALRSGRATRVLIARDIAGRPRVAAIERLAAAQGVAVRACSAAELDVLAGGERHQGVAAEVRAFGYVDLETLLVRPRTHPPLLLVLDGIEDPHNLGAILRSADAVGVDGVIVPERRAVPVTPVVARASAGAVDHVPIAQVVNLTRAIERLKERRVWVYGLDMDGEVTFDEVDYAGPVAIVAGAEGRGLGRLVRKACDVLVRIPLYGHVESLNVSVATSLALFAARRARDRGARDEGRRTGDEGRAPLDEEGRAGEP